MADQPKLNQSVRAICEEIIEKAEEELRAIQNGLTSDSYYAVRNSVLNLWTIVGNLREEAARLDEEDADA